MGDQAPEISKAKYKAVKAELRQRELTKIQNQEWSEMWMCRICTVIMGPFLLIFIISMTGALFCSFFGSNRPDFCQSVYH